MRTFVAILVAIFALLSPAVAACANNANAATAIVPSLIPADGQFHLTALTLTLSKISNQSTLFYTNQITYQFDAAGPYGAQFKMRVKDANGSYIMPDMMTGGVSLAANAYNNAILSDTVFDTLASGDPPTGSYTFELWALSGGGQLTVDPYMSNIAVLELPNAQCQN